MISFSFMPSSRSIVAEFVMVSSSSWRKYARPVISIGVVASKWLQVQSRSIW